MTLFWFFVGSGYFLAIMGFLMAWFAHLILNGRE